MININTFRAAALATLCAFTATPMLTVTARAQYADSALAAAGVVTKAQAEVIALQAVGSGHVIGARFEKGDAIPHWSVDIVVPHYDYEVWVNTAGRVLRVIQQPR